MDINLKNGALTELKCQMFLIEQNCIVSKPILDNARYDLLIDINNNISINVSSIDVFSLDGLIKGIISFPVFRYKLQ